MHRIGSTSIYLKLSYSNVDEAGQSDCPTSSPCANYHVRVIGKETKTD